jgi:GntR family transcriptional regulator
VIDFDPERPVHRQIADFVRTQIARGELAPGQRLPSEPDLAATYNVSRTTIRAAVTALKGEGLIVVEQRPGFPRATYVRQTGPMQTVPLKPGDTATARMPSPAERREHDISEGVPVLVVSRKNGKTELYPGDSTVIGR